MGERMATKMRTSVSPKWKVRCRMHQVSVITSHYFGPCRELLNRIARPIIQT